MVNTWEFLEACLHIGVGVCHETQIQSNNKIFNSEEIRIHCYSESSLKDL